jgi:hypothetical protein
VLGAFGGMIFVLFRSQALAEGTVSVLMKRMELRLSRSISDISRSKS